MLELDSHVYSVGDRVLVRFNGEFDRVEAVHPNGSNYHYRLEEAGDVMSREISPCGGCRLAITKEDFPIMPFAADKLQINSHRNANITLNAMVHRGPSKPPLSFVVIADTVIAAIGALTFIRDKYPTFNVTHEIIETTRAVHQVVDFTRKESEVAGG